MNLCSPTCSFSILLAQAATRIPCEANILAIALPDPMEAPVTKAARPSHFSMLNYCTGKWPDTHRGLSAFTCPGFWEDASVSWSMCTVCCPVSPINSAGVFLLTVKMCSRQQLQKTMRTLYLAGKIQVKLYHQQESVLTRVGENFLEIATVFEPQS